MCPFGLDIVGAGSRLDCGIVLILTVVPGSLTVEESEETVYQLCLVLHSFRLGSISIEMCEAISKPFYLPKAEQHAQNNKIDFQDVYRVDPVVGTSIGPYSSRVETGSIGFFLKLELLEDDEVKFLAATCHHVVAPGIEEPLTWHAKIAVASPSPNDHAAWIACLSPRTGQLGVENLSGIGNPSGNLSSEFTTGSTVVNQVAPASTNINKSLLQIVRGFDLHLGSVLLTSGLADKCSEDNCRLDWALVDVANSRLPTGFDTLSNRPPKSLQSHAATFDFHNPSPNEDVVFKMGRTTGPTVGKLHSPRVIERVYRSAGCIQSLERVIVAYDDKAPFALPGDSGALVYGAQGQGLGIVWGGPWEESPKSTESTKLGMVVYFISLEATYRDMSTRLARQYGEGKIRLSWLG